MISGAAEAVRAGGKRNRVQAGIVFFDEDGEKLVSLDPVEVCRRLQSRDAEERP
jgi:preprotein translocase subunit Sec61beta